MNRVILSNIISEFFSKNNKLIICSLSYHIAIALVPNLLLVYKLLSTFNINASSSFLLKIGPLYSESSLLIIFGISLLLLYKGFHMIFYDKSNPFLPLFLSFFIITFLPAITLSSIIKNTMLKICFQFFLTVVLLILFNYISNKKISIISFVFSSLFSFILIAFYFFFEVIEKEFLHYDNYYGYLSPLFLILLEIYISINIIYLNTSTIKVIEKFSVIKFIKS